MTSGLTAMAATTLLVFGRAIQQQNVIHGHYLAAALTPSLIAAGEIAVVGAIVVSGWTAWPWISAGGAFGAVGAMWIHRIFRSRHEQRQPQPIHETENALSQHGPIKSKRDSEIISVKGGHAMRACKEALHKPGIG